MPMVGDTEFKGLKKSYAKGQELELLIILAMLLGWFNLVDMEIIIL